MTLRQRRKRTDDSNAATMNDDSSQSTEDHNITTTNTSVPLEEKKQASSTTSNHKITASNRNSNNSTQENDSYSFSAGSTSLAEADSVAHDDEFEVMTATTATTTTSRNNDGVLMKQILCRESSPFEGDNTVTSTANTVTRPVVTKPHDEHLIRKFITRMFAGLFMVFGFCLFLYAGHVYICALIALCELLLFRELVKVRYYAFFHIIEETIPLFRTTQWMWFAVAIFYTYSDFVVEVIKGNPDLHHLLTYSRFLPPAAFMLYSGTFVLTIATMQTGHIKFQINQLCWTIVVLCLTVGQLKYIMHNVYNGLIWFALPIMLVVFNDSGAYIAGMTCGRKFVHRPFINLSPNKTWEGFIGGGIFTMIAGWYLSGVMAQFTWMTCPTNRFSLFPDKLECDLDPIFHAASNIFHPQIFDIFPVAFVKMIPGVVDVCSVNGDASMLTACVSGEATHAHHHFELVVKGVFPIQIHALGLALFASIVAPFGGFLASGIKRAYGIKDFGSMIAGHGGMMDRFDCQFLMALYTWVHYNTFVKMATVSVPKMIYMYNLLKEHEQVEFLEKITEMAAETSIQYEYALDAAP